MEIKRRKKNSGQQTLHISITAILALTVFISYGCNQNPVPPAKGIKVQSVKKPVNTAAVIQPQDLGIEPFQHEGYIYNQRGRRDPFVPLVVSSVDIKKKDIIKTGTLEGYDAREFSLSAIAKKGKHYYALVVSPDNKSFTINPGTIIGLNRGKVKAISSDKVLIVEHTKDYRGGSVPREIILEFHKGDIK